MQDAGIAPALWKVDGLPSEAQCARVVELCGAEDGGEVGVIVLGRNAPAEEVAAWLRAAARTPGYVGFAVGRTIWGGAIEELIAGTLSAEAASERISAAYRALVEAYDSVG